MKTDAYEVIAFYKFVAIDDCDSWAPVLKQHMLDRDILGTILLANEGINGTICGKPESIEQFITIMQAHDGLGDLPVKTSYAPGHVFNRAKVKVKPSLISIGDDERADPNRQVGTYVKPKDWNALISDPEVVLIDTRNEYEFHAGTFEGAVDPKITRFRELPEFVKKNYDPKVHKKVAMFCTGGIRCERSTAWMLEEGFEEVFHLEGGILKYLEEVHQEESLWKGDCYVFDERVGVNHELAPSDAAKFCPGCGHALTTKLRCAPEYIAGERCPFCP
ncbi:MAG: rhodanese-related sulfurtransferase [Phycisphaerales bacterium]|nr:rhodanese-related sulfurtransferase [Phycisphaerales bacterium]